PTGVLVDHFNQICSNRIDRFISAKALRELPLALIWIADKQQSLVHEHVSNPLLAAFGPHRMSRPRFCDRVGRVNDATERFDKRRHRRIKLSVDLYSIHSRNGNELGQSTGQSRDSMLAIKLALVTILCAAIVTQNLAATAHTIQALVHHYSIAFMQISNRAADLLDDAGNLMTENLRLQSKWNWLPVFVRVVVCVTGEDVYVSSAKTDGGNANQHLVGRYRGTRNVAH